VGDGSTTFNLPNYTNRMPYGAAIGTTGGADTTTLITANLPSHTHTFSVTTSGSGTTGGTGSGTSFTNLSPYLGINFIIKT
jgi:microcystin-dependent protein